MGFKLLPKMRVNYWSNGCVATFIRKALNAPAKPGALTMEDWNAWERNQRNNHKLAYWLTDTFLKKVQNFIFYPYDVYDSLRYYIKYRFVRKSHYLHTKLEVGEYYAPSTRVLNGLFETLAEYVEVELAQREYFSNSNLNRYSRKPWWKPFRNKYAGLSYLIKAASEIEDGEITRHAKEYTEIFNLYTWWIRRPYRDDPAVLSGYDTFRKKYRDKDSFFPNYDSLSELDRKKQSNIFKKMQEIEKLYEDEDIEKMVKLVTIIDTLR